MRGNPCLGGDQFSAQAVGLLMAMVLGVIIMSFATILLGQEPRLWRMIGIRFGIAENLALIVMFCGIGIGIFCPASNNACIELMPEKVATITGLKTHVRLLEGKDHEGQTNLAQGTRSLLIE